MQCLQIHLHSRQGHYNDAWLTEISHKMSTQAKGWHFWLTAQMWLLLSLNLLKWRLCQVEKIFHPLGIEMDVHKQCQVNRHKLCHILYVLSSSLMCMQHATKHWSLHCSPLDTRLVVKMNMMWQTEGSRGRRVMWTWLVHAELFFFFPQNFIWDNPLQNNLLD